MAKNLVIVESPAKMKTVKKFLGANYAVEASNGHVRDFPKSQFGIDVDNDFEPKYITIRGKGELLAKLRKEAKKASLLPVKRLLFKSDIILSSSFLHQSHQHELSQDTGCFSR